MATKNMQTQSGHVGLKVAPKLVGTVVVYSRNDGRVVHSAQFVHFGSGEAPTEAVMEKKVLNSVGAKVKELDLAVLHHKGDPLKPDTGYRVEVSGGGPRLVEVRGAR
jgi:hypothetical protein